MRWVVLVLVAACALDHHTRDGGSDLELDLGGRVFRVSSGTARVSGTTLVLYLSDQPDACLAITQIPRGTAGLLALQVVPQGDGTRSAVVVQASSPGAGQATGSIKVRTEGIEDASYDAVDGNVAWTMNGDGSTTIDALDIGFVGTTDRLRATALTIPSCP